MPPCLIRLSGDICSAFQNEHHFMLLKINIILPLWIIFHYSEIKSNE